MAYTGILLRGDAYSTIYNDGPIAREATIAGEHMMVAGISSTSYTLNLAALAEISKVTGVGGTVDAGIKTSTLGITFDGDGYIKNAVDHMLILGTHKFRHAALNNIEVASATELQIEGVEIDTALLGFITSTPSITGLTTADITISWDMGVTAKVYNQTTETYLGELTTAGTLTFGAAQTVGDIITVKMLDVNYNESANTKGTVA